MKPPYEFKRQRKKLGIDFNHARLQPQTTVGSFLPPVEKTRHAKEETQAERPKKPPVTLPRFSFAAHKRPQQAKRFQRKPLEEKTASRTSIVQRKKAKPTKPLFLLPPAKPPKPIPEAAQDEFLKLSKAYEHVNLEDLDKKIAYRIKHEA